MSLPRLAVICGVLATGEIAGVVGLILVRTTHGKLAHHLERLETSAGKKCDQAPRSGSSGWNVKAQTHSGATQPPR
jgi:hypothetical protein